MNLCQTHALKSIATTKAKVSCFNTLNNSFQRDQKKRLNVVRE